MPSDEERVPSLDAEACARLLDDLILMLAPHDAQSIADANQLRALKLALPGMGKENEHLQEIATTGLAWLQDLRPVLHVGGTYGNAMCDEFTSPTDLHVKALLRFSGYLAARAAQPEETRTCTGVAARWCPIHGDCTGVPDEQIPTAPYSDHCSDRDCPLHGTRSMHAAGNLSG